MDAASVDSYFDLYEVVARALAPRRGWGSGACVRGARSKTAVNGAQTGHKRKASWRAPKSTQSPKTNCETRVGSIFGGVEIKGVE